MIARRAVRTSGAADCGARQRRGQRRRRAVVEVDGRRRQARCRAVAASRSTRRAATSGARSEPKAAVAMKQPESWVNWGAGVLKTWKVGGDVPQTPIALIPTP